MVTSTRGRALIRLTDKYMGLDMMLFKEIDPRNNPDFNGEENDSNFIEVGYWRKANQIHRWFVDNVQNGVDNCKKYPVTRKQLNDLLELVNKVLKASKLVKGDVSQGQSYHNGEFIDIIGPGKTIEDPTVAKQLLPTQKGFFFGNYGYDECYIDDLKDTKKIIDKVNKLWDEEEDVKIYYESSW